jgi:hypothetical protein
MLNTNILINLNKSILANDVYQVDFTQDNNSNLASKAAKNKAPSGALDSKNFVGILKFNSGIL